MILMTAADLASQPAIGVETLMVDAGLAATQLEVQARTDRDYEAMAASRMIYEALARIETDADARAQAQLSAAGLATEMGDVATAMVHLTAVENSAPARYRAEAASRKADLF